MDCGIVVDTADPVSRRRRFESVGGLPLLSCLEGDVSHFSLWAFMEDIFWQIFCCIYMFIRPQNCKWWALISRPVVIHLPWLVVTELAEESLRCNANPSYRFRAALWRGVCKNSRRLFHPISHLPFSSFLSVFLRWRPPGMWRKWMSNSENRKPWMSNSENRKMEERERGENRWKNNFTSHFPLSLESRNDERLEGKFFTEKPSKF